MDWQRIIGYLNEIEDSIKNDAPVNTGALKESITANLEQTTNGFTIGISMLDYGPFLDQGVNGTEVDRGSQFSFKNMPPSSVFSSYASTANGQFAIAKSVMKNGIAPRNFIEPNLDPLLDNIADFSAEDLWDYFYQQNK